MIFLKKELADNVKKDNKQYFEDVVVLDSNKKTYIEQSSPQLKSILDKILDKNSLEKLSKHCVNFLSGRYRYGFFVDDLATATKELLHIGLKSKDISQLIERSYGPLNQKQKQIITKSETEISHGF